MPIQIDHDHDHFSEGLERVGHVGVVEVQGVDSDYGSVCGKRARDRRRHAMTITDVPQGWKRVSYEWFEDYLKGCEDYTRMGYIGAVQYQFRRGNRVFAEVRETEHGEQIYVNPKFVPLDP